MKPYKACVDAAKCMGGTYLKRKGTVSECRYVLGCVGEVAVG